MALTQQQKTDAYQFFIIAFGAAPGTEYLSQLDEAYSAGMTTKQIVNVYTTKPQFLALYPEALTTAEFANNLVENVVGANASEAAKAEAKSDVIGALNAGWSKGDVVYQIFSNLASKPVTDTAWGQTSAMFANKVAVAAYVTETLKVSTTDLATLQAYVAPVTSAPESVTAAEAFAITADASTVNEGGMVIFNIANGVANTEYAIKLGGVQAADINGDLVRVVTTDAAGKASLEVAIAADSATEGAETLTASVLTKTATASVVINDTSVNTAPTVTAGQIFTIVEGSAAAAAVGTVVATDVEGDAISYAITSGNDAGLFAINAATGAITLTAAGAAALDREGAVNSYSLGITATDAKSNVGTQTPVTITVGDASDVAPVAVAATAAANEAGAVVTGNLTATDVDTVDAGKLTYELKAAVEGLTINADGSYSFDPKLNTVANGLTYDQVDGVNIPATFIVTDSGGNKGEGTLTINVKPVPLSFKIEANKASAEEGATTTYTVTASEALTQAVNVEFTLQPGDGAAANTGTKETNTADFATGAFNPKTVQIKAGEKTATFDVVAVNDANTELQEGYTVQAVIAGQPTMTLGGKVVDATGAGGVGQTFTLTTGIDTMPGLIGSANSAGTDGNDTIVGLIDTVTAANTTVNALDQINGGLGNNSMTLNVVGNVTAAIPAGVTISNVQTMNVRGSGDLGTGGAKADFDVTGATGLTALNVTLGTLLDAKAASTTAVTVSGVSGTVDVNGGASQTVTGGTDVTLLGSAGNISVTNATGAVGINGGKDVTVNVATADQSTTVGAITQATGTITVTDSNLGKGGITIDGGTAVTVTATSATSTGVTKIGAGKAASGAVNATFNLTSDGTAPVNGGAITVTGGSSVNVSQNLTVTAKDETASNAHAGGAVTVNSDGKTKEVTSVQTYAETEFTKAGTAVVKETSVVTFAAMTNAQTLTINGLTFTASKDLTAAQVAEAFANLTLADTQTAAGTANGYFTGAFNAAQWTSGAAAGAVVTFTAIDDDETDLTFGGTATAPTQVKTAGKPVVGDKTSSNTATYGAVVVNGNATASITTVTVNGYATADLGDTGTDLNALTTLSLANSGGAADVATSATTLGLTVNNVQHTVNLDNTAATIKNLNVTTAGKDSAFALTAAAVEALAVSGDKAVDLSGSTLTALKTVTVGGSAGLTIDASGAKVTSVNASATSGAVTAKVDAANATYTGGSGVDTVTLAASVVAKAVALGAGDDVLDASAATLTGTFTLDGGEGADTIKLSETQAAALSADPTFETKMAGFEKLSVGDTTAARTVDLSNLDDINYVISNAVTTAALTLNKFGANGTVEVAGANGSGVTASLADATGTSDVFNIVLKNATAGTVTVAGVETVNVAANVASTLTLTAAAAKTVNVTGAATLNLNDATAATLIDASGKTAGGLTFSANGTAAQTVKGGAGADNLTAVGSGDVLEGGAGNDTLTGADLTTLRGGEGNDTFVMNMPTNVNSYTTIADIAAGDVIDFSDSSAAFNKSAVVLASTAVFQDYANAAVNALGTDGDDIAWFQYSGDTYIVQSGNSTAGNDFVNGEDSIIKLTGLVDLSAASYNITNGTLEIV